MARPTKENKYGDLYEATEAELHALLTKVPIALRELIEGVWREEPTRNGDTRVYRERPSIEAIKLLLERTQGKVPTKVEVEGNMKQTILDISDYKDEEVDRMVELALANRKGELGGENDGE